MTVTRRRTLTLAGAVLAVMVGVGACSHSADPNGPAAGAQSASSVPKEPAADAVNGAASPAPLAQREAASSPAVGAIDNTSGSGSQARTTSLTLAAGSKIRTAQISAEVARARDVTGRADRAGVIAESVGGEIDSDNRTSGRYAQADLVLRVPPTNLTSVLAQLAHLGKERSRELSTTDVTEKVADVTSRVVSARQSIARLRVLYADADKVSTVLAVEDDLSSREADLEAVEAQQRTLARQTSLATITVSLQTASAGPTTPPKQHRSGFLGGLRRGWDAFTAAATSAAGGLGAALPFAGLALLLGLAARLVWRRRPTRTVPAPAPGPSL